MTTFELHNRIGLDEAARLLGVHKATLLRAIGNGELEAVRIGRSYTTTEAALERYVQAKTVNAPVLAQEPAEQGV